MVVYCTVCLKNNRKNKDISYFGYPKDSVRRQMWLKAVGREDLLSKLDDDKTRQQYRICEDHFETSCITRNKIKKYLLANAFPTINLPPNGGACSSSSQCENVSRQQNDTIEFIPTTGISSSTNSSHFHEIVNLKDQSRCTQVELEKHSENRSAQTALHLSADTPRKRKIGMELWDAKKCDLDSVTKEDCLKLCDSDESSSAELEVGIITETLTGVQDPLANISTDHQCRFCAKITNNYIDASDKPYVKNNKTKLAVNDVNIEIDFNDTLKVCLNCDMKLLEMFNFVKLVKNAQDALLNVSYDMEATETLVVKTECESPTPDDNEIDNEDTKEGIVDSITIDETAFVKDNVYVHKKRKCDKDTKREASKRQKKAKVDNTVTCEDAELIMDIKEEAVETDDVANTSNVHKDAYSDDKDTGPDIKPSELDIATNTLLNQMAGDDFS